jgi:DNA polymerase III delta prime subunit
MMVDLLLQKYNYNKISIYSDSDKPLINQKTSFKNNNIIKNAIVIHDIDTWSFPVEYIKTSSVPIICICNNKYDKHVKSIIGYCLEIPMYKPYFNEILYLKKSYTIDEKILRQLYDSSNGDIRYILNVLQLGIVETKDMNNSNIFQTTELLFSKKSLEEKDIIYWANDLHPAMIQENYISKDFEKLADAADYLSVSDIFDQKIQESKMFEFDGYKEFSILGASCNTPLSIKFPKHLGFKRKTTFDDSLNCMNVKAAKISKVSKIKTETSKFDNMTKTELLAECEKLKITKYKSKNKHELIQLIESFNQMNIT